MDLVLELEGLHKKEINSKMSGSVRVLLKTEDDRDQICISDAIWDLEQMPLSKQVGRQTKLNTGRPCSKSFVVQRAPVCIIPKPRYVVCSMRPSTNLNPAPLIIADCPNRCRPTSWLLQTSRWSRHLRPS